MREVEATRRGGGGAEEGYSRSHGPILPRMNAKLSRLKHHPHAELRSGVRVGGGALEGTHSHRLAPLNEHKHQATI